MTSICSGRDSVQLRVKRKRKGTHLETEVEVESSRSNRNDASRRRILNSTKGHIWWLDPHCTYECRFQPVSFSYEMQERGREEEYEEDVQKNAATIPMMMSKTSMMLQQHTRPQHLALPPLVNAPACSSLRHILRPSFFGICPSAAICRDSRCRSSVQREGKKEKEGDAPEQQCSPSLRAPLSRRTLRRWQT
jgi:hypothetical protein